MDSMTKTAIITGAGSGIDLGLAEAFAREGTNAVLNARNEDKLAREVVEIGQRDQLTAVVADVSPA